MAKQSDSADNSAMQKSGQAKNTKSASQNPPGDVSSPSKQNRDHGKR